MMNSQDFRAQTSPFQIKNRTKSDIFIVKPNQQGRNSQFRTQHSPMQQFQKRSQTSLITITKESTPTNGYRSSLTRDQLRVVNEDLLDQLISSSLGKTLNQAFEPAAKQMFQCEKCILWVDNPEGKYLFSQTYNLKAGYDNTLPGFIFRTRSLIQVRDPSNAPNGFKSDPNLVPPKSPQLFFALTTGDISRAVVQVVQKPNTPGFTRTDIETANLIISKFSIYGNTIFTSRNLSTLAETFYSYNAISINPIDLIIKYFRCESCEMWQFDTMGNHAQRVYDAYQKDPPINIENCGIVGDAILSNRPINIPNASDDKNFVDKIDGNVAGPVLIVTTEPNRRDTWAIVLRGRETQFSATDEAQLRSLLPFVIGALVGFNSNDERSVFIQQLTELLKTAANLTEKISNVDIIKMIQEESIKMLECESCVIFLLSKDKKHITGHYNDSHHTVKRFSIGKGICSHVIQTGEIISLLDPSDSDNYDAQIDSSDYSTNNLSPSSILCSPIRNFNGDIIGCLELLSKTGGDRFTENDQKVLSAFNVFVGIAIENTRNYSQAANLSKKLRAFIEMLLHTNKESELLPLLEDILDTAKHFMHAQRVSFFISDGPKLSLFLNVGEKSQYGTFFAEIAKEKKEMTTFSEEEIREHFKDENDADSNGQQPPNQTFSNATENTDTQTATSLTKSEENDQTPPQQTFSVISEIFNENDHKPTYSSSQRDPRNNESLCCAPLLNHEGSALGVLEISFTDIYLDEDFELVDSFASVASLCLERIPLKQTAMLGHGPLDVREWLSASERMTTSPIPSKLELSDDVFTSFEIERYDGIGLFKIVFKIFDQFGINEKFGIKNETLFNFVEAARKRYGKKNNHGWRHAVETLQFAASQIIDGKLDKEIFSQLEILALFVAAILHDVDHEWLKEAAGNDDENEDDFEFEFGQSSDEDQTILPLNILMKKVSLLETHHIEEAIEIITSKDECNIFINLNDQDYQDIWEMVIKLINATDMRKHFKIVKKLESALNNNEFDLKSNQKDRLLLMKCLIKAADLSKIVRPFNDSKNYLIDWNVNIAEEFFRQGNLKETQGMVFISINKDYANLDKDASLIGFFNFVCIPLFQAISNAVPQLKENTNTVIDNIQKWAKKTGRALPSL